ncbi:MAG: hypothetical protein HY800_06280, partial [Ignavibacteriales bacterium]|nr:hypothetical protein [Ignavibacteriales bacterium]
MEDNERIRQEIFKADRELANNSKYQNEEYPARMFRDHADEYLGIKVQNLINNYPNDPPDFFIQADGQQINLEVTALGNEWILEKNSFFKKLESIAMPIIDKYICLLPDGFFYLLY